MSNQVSNPFENGKSQTSAIVETSAAKAENSRAVAEVQAALFIARTNPRDPVKAVDRILNACTRPSLAMSATYAYSRGGSDISGPSIRLAETIAQQWGNIQYGIRELSQSNGVSEVQAYAWDVETNTRREIVFAVPHMRYTRKGSYELTDPRDIYELVANQGARRLRACILGVVPGDVVESAVAQCDVTLKSNVDLTPERIQELVNTFENMGVTKAQLEKFVQCRIEAVRPAQVIRLRKIYTSLRDGMSTPSDWFEAVEGTESESETPKAPKRKSAKKEPSQIEAPKQEVEVIQPEEPKPEEVSPKITAKSPDDLFANVGQVMNMNIPNINSGSGEYDYAIQELDKCSSLEQINKLFNSLSPKTKAQVKSIFTTRRAALGV